MASMLLQSSLASVSPACAAAHSCSGKAVQRSVASGFRLRSQPAALIYREQGASRVAAFFRFGGQDARGAGIYGAQKREDFSASDCEHYFEYTGMLAAERSYDSLHAMIASGIHPADVLLLLAASDGDVPKIEEMLQAGADVDAKDLEGRTSLDRAQNDEVKRILQEPSLVW